MTKTDTKLTLALFVALMCAVLAGACGPGQPTHCVAEEAKVVQICSPGDAPNLCRQARHELAKCQDDGAGD